MNNAPVSIRRLLTPLKTAVAKGLAARAERCGKFRTGRLLRRREGGITDAKHTLGLCKRPAVSHPGSSRGISPKRDDNGPNIPALHEILAGSRPLVNCQVKQTGVCHKRAACGGRERTAAKPLQFKDLFPNSHATKRQSALRRHCCRSTQPLLERSRGWRLSLCPTGRCGFDEVPMCSEKSGTGVEREPDAESLLAGGAFGSPQLLRNL